MTPELLQLEQKIQNLIKPIESLDLRVITDPDPGDKQGTTRLKNYLIVRFESETLSEPLTQNNINTTGVLQQSQIEFILELWVKNLRTNDGVYPIIERLRRLITGRRIEPEFGPCFLSGTKYVSHKDGQWHYDMSLKFNLKRAMFSYSDYDLEDDYVGQQI